MPLFRNKETKEIIRAFHLGLDPIPDWFMNLVTENKAVLISDDRDVMIKCKNVFNMATHNVGEMIIKQDNLIRFNGMPKSEFDELYERLPLADGKIDKCGNLILKRVRNGKEFYIHAICPFMSKDIQNCIYCGDRCPHFSDIYNNDDTLCLDLCQGKTLFFGQLEDKRELVTEERNEDEEQN
jgi:hypothetical protein